MSVLIHDDISKRLEALPDWHHRGNALEKRFDRGDFDGSIAFVNAVAGSHAVTSVYATLGTEQEYFVVDKRFAALRRFARAVAGAGATVVRGSARENAGNVEY